MTKFKFVENKTEKLSPPFGEITILIYEEKLCRKRKIV